MAIKRAKKETLVSGYTEKLQRSQAMIITEYRGLTVKQLEALRRELRGCESEMVISKNSLMTRALTDVGMAAPESLLTGPTAVTFCFGELAAPAKALGSADFLRASGAKLAIASYDDRLRVAAEAMGFGLYA